MNSDNLQYLLYRPLYWFGGNGQPYLNRSLSLASKPEYSGQTVTIKLDKSRWSDGTTLTAQDIVFWMNMMKAVVSYSVRYSSNSVNWGGYVPGGFPDNVRSVHAVGTDEVKMVIKGPYSRQWFTDNELSQITPMPLAWDVTASSKSDCAQVQTNCVAVFKYLDRLSKDPGTWAKSKIWGVVDGPLKLTGLTTQGMLTFSYNQGYSGPVPTHHITTSPRCLSPRRKRSSTCWRPAAATRSMSATCRPSTRRCRRQDPRSARTRCPVTGSSRSTPGA